MLSPTEFIGQKRDGLAHAQADLQSWIARYANGQIADYQMAAWAMAVYLRGMTTEETAWLTQSMLDSGVTLAWSERDLRPVVDKHSTGGVGDKISLLLAPMLACCGLRVPMISGRGLGPTGGTLDKLESIPGYTALLPPDEIQRIVDDVGCVIAGATDAIAPADKKLYALRDVTGTVACIPLITASIMSKKLAEGLDALVLDVKCGSGAFMKNLDDAVALAGSLVSTGERMGVATSALITDMSQPLGEWIGNAVEVDETVAALQANGPADVVELTIELGALALVRAEVCDSTSQGREQLQSVLDCGAAFEKFGEMIRAQGGDVSAPRERARAFPVHATSAGVVTRIETDRLGQAVIQLGGGRRTKSDPIDHAVGIRMAVRIGSRVSEGDLLAEVLARDASSARETSSMVAEAIRIEETNVAVNSPLILQRFEAPNG